MRLHEREVDGEEEVAERRARATDGEEVEVVAVAGRWEGLAVRPAPVEIGFLLPHAFVPPPWEACASAAYLV